LGARISAGRWVRLDDLGHGEGLARAGDAEQHLVCSLAWMPSTRSAMAVGWSPFGSYSEASLIGTPPSDFGGNMGRVCGEGKRPEEQKENKNGPY
jgi:hypothetical protein